jgi:hypothetical protein
MSATPNTKKTELTTNNNTIFTAFLEGQARSQIVHKLRQIILLNRNNGEIEVMAHKLDSSLFSGTQEYRTQFAAREKTSGRKKKKGERKSSNLNLWATINKNIPKNLTKILK